MEADHAKRLPNNAPGKYFTTEECDGCAYCAAVAPDNFEFDKPTNTYFVTKQPVDFEEDELVRDAKEDCPVDAIRMQEPPSETMVVEDAEHGSA